MIDLTLLQNVEFAPVLELEPWRFAAPGRPRPLASVLDEPAAWDCYWLDCLLDAGITGLKPLRPGSWDVLVRELDDGPTLRNILPALVGDRGPIEAPIDADGSLVLDGGLALFSKGELLVSDVLLRPRQHLGMARRYGIPEVRVEDTLDRPPMAVRAVRGRLTRHRRAARVRYALGPVGG